MMENMGGDEQSLEKRRFVFFPDRTVMGIGIGKGLRCDVSIYLQLPRNRWEMAQREVYIVFF